MPSIYTIFMYQQGSSTPAGAQPRILRRGHLSHLVQIPSTEPRTCCGHGIFAHNLAKTGAVVSALLV